MMSLGCDSLVYTNKGLQKCAKNCLFQFYSVKQPVRPFIHPVLVLSSYLNQDTRLALRVGLKQLARTCNVTYRASPPDMIGAMVGQAQARCSLFIRTPFAKHHHDCPDHTHRTSSLPGLPCCVHQA